MLHLALQDIVWAFLYITVGVAIGVSFILAFAALVPSILGKLTPHLDEGKEIARGNQAVAEYFGRVTAATILGMSIVIAAATLGGILAALHG
jgi:hypothetical protein